MCGGDGDDGTFTFVEHDKDNDTYVSTNFYVTVDPYYLFPLILVFSVERFQLLYTCFIHLNEYYVNRYK